ncbi:MAG: pantothenate kinase [Sphaerospermopsis sp. SIO1G2]|nr:pantothenate kinase [Sphaerospermopsis sp. SIO1G2]
MLDSQGEVLAMASLHMGIPQCSTDREQLKALNDITGSQKSKVKNQKSEIELQSLISPHLPISPPPDLPLLIASVVPEQTAKWQNYPNAEFITLDQIPLTRMYSTLGIDRALAVFGAGKNYGFPILVIDAGTALTFTGADANQNLIGGAILPGLGLQFTSLGQKTGQLPLLKVREVQELPPRFALDTKSAIESGIIYTLLAGIKDFIDNWLLSFPDSQIAMTGGDSELLGSYLKQEFPKIGEQIILDQNLIFWGMKELNRRVC